MFDCFAAALTKPNLTYTFAYFDGFQRDVLKLVLEDLTTSSSPTPADFGRYRAFICSRQMNAEREVCCALLLLASRPANVVYRTSIVDVVTRVALAPARASAVCACADLISDLYSAYAITPSIFVAQAPTAWLCAGATFEFLTASLTALKGCSLYATSPCVAVFIWFSTVRARTATLDQRSSTDAEAALVHVLDAFLLVEALDASLLRQIERKR